MASNILKRYPDILSVVDIQKILNIGRSSAYKLLKSGDLRSLRIGAIYRIPKAYLLDFIRENA